MKGRRQISSDDGRVIADMSGIKGDCKKRIVNRSSKLEMEEEYPPKAREMVPPSTRERLGLIWRTILAGLVVALIFMAGFGILIALISYWGQ